MKNPVYASRYQTLIKNEQQKVKNSAGNNTVNNCGDIRHSSNCDRIRRNNLNFLNDTDCNCQYEYNNDFRNRDYNSYFYENYNRLFYNINNSNRTQRHSLKKRIRERYLSNKRNKKNEINVKDERNDISRTHIPQRIQEVQENNNFNNFANPEFDNNAQQEKVREILNKYGRNAEDKW